MPFIKTDFSIPLCEIEQEKDLAENNDDGGGSTFRPICFKCRVFDGPPGSAYAEFGGTKVLARVSGPVDDPNGDPNTATLSLKMKGVSDEVRIGAQVLSVIKTCVMAHKYSQCSFDVEVTVVNDDGGLLQCAIIAATLALADAEVMMLDMVVAAHIARTTSGEFVVDPRKSQITDGCSECTLALMPNQNQIVCCDIRGGHLTSTEIEELITFATEKSMKLYPVLRKALLATILVQGEAPVDSLGDSIDYIDFGYHQYILFPTF